ncbi:MULTISPECIES: hypothetical protein [unclassified Spirillospora]|uniref:hypothetical protein n=1 Tax=unclassified Spirillospora TaxID=2642701 RepID=UPI00371E8AB4
MTRLQHVHALVRQAAAGHRKPGVHGPAFRLTALVTGLAVATTTLTAAPDRASAAHPATDPAAGPGPLPRSASPPALLQGTAPPDVPPQNAASPDVPPQGAMLPGTEPTGAAPQGATSANAAPQHAPSQGVAPEKAAAPSGAVRPGVLPLDIPESQRLEQRFVKDILRGNGIRWTSTGGCSNRKVTTCTSFENIRWGTIKGLIGFAESSGCEITVTGGTERGHASGTHSHWNGYKADIAPGRCVDRAIKRYPSAGVRGDGAELYRSPGGALFAREKDHWDVTFR